MTLAKIHGVHKIFGAPHLKKRQWGQSPHIKTSRLHLDI